jgi:hypothetical protein
MKAKGTGISNKPSHSKPVSVKNTMTAGCYRLTIENLEYARNYKGEVIHDEGNMLAFDATFLNDAGQRIKLRMWNTEKGRWVSDALLRAIGIDTRQTGAVDVHDVYGKQIYACVAVVMDAHNGVPVGQPKDYKLLPETITPVRPYHTETPYYKGDPQKGDNPLGTKFMILEDIETPPVQAEIPDLFSLTNDEENPFA